MRLVALTGARYHAAHVATAAGIEVIRQAKARGLNVTCDTAPPYFLLNDTAVGEYRTFAKLSPPLRSEDDRKAVQDGLRDGTIDCIASDHAPQDQDAKRLPFAQAEPGAVGLETLLALSLTPYHNGRMTLLDVMRALTLRPAEIFGFDAGRLAAGAPADLVVFDPDKPWRIEPERFRSKSKNSPFDGHPTQGRALRTVVNGATVFTLGDEPRG
jgi:dihydroorotase